ncbi:MAG TPA: hypothetical protein PKH72_08070 [Rhodoferax sp.]|nr:hypothetical protein [Rhodoferax sp.]HNV59597.1 hypothetical protein [Rhodoferax sp.]
MAINSITSKEVPKAPPKAAPIEAAKAAVERKQVNNDRAAQEAEAAKAADKAKAAKPVSNNLGQTIGRTLNVTA